MVVHNLEQPWEILRHYFENHGNVADCKRKLRTDSAKRIWLCIRLNNAGIDRLTEDGDLFTSIYRFSYYLRFDRQLSKKYFFHTSFCSR